MQTMLNTIVDTRGMNKEFLHFFTRNNAMAAMLFADVLYHIQGILHLSDVLLIVPHTGLQIFQPFLLADIALSGTFQSFF